MAEVDFMRSGGSGMSSMRGRSQGKSSFQRELNTKLKDRKARGLSADLSDDSDDDGLGSDDDLLATFNATSRYSNRPGSAKHRGSPTAGMRGESPSASILRESPSASILRSSPGLRASPGLGGEPVPSPRYSKSGVMTAEEIVRQRQLSTPTPPPKPQPRKGASPQPERKRPLTKEDIIFGGKNTRKDTSELPLREEKKQWQPPTFLRNSPLGHDEPRASPRSSRPEHDGRSSDRDERRSSRAKRDSRGSDPRDDDDDDDLVIGQDVPDGAYRGKMRASPDYRNGERSDRRQSTSPFDPRSADRRQSTSPFDPRSADRRQSTSPFDPRNRQSRGESPTDGRRSPFERETPPKRGLRKQEAVITESPEHKRSFMKPKKTDDKPKPEPRSRSGSAGSEVFKKSGRTTPKYMIEDEQSEDSADEFLRKVKEHKVTLSGRGTPDGRKTPSKDSGRQTPPSTKDRKTPTDHRKSSSPDGRKSPFDRKKSDGNKEKEEEEPRRKSVFDVLVGDDQDDKKRKDKRKDEKKEEKKRGDKTPSPAPRKRPPSATSSTSDRGRSPSPSKLEKPSPPVRHSKDEDLQLRRPSRSPAAHDIDSSICDDVEEDPMKKKIEAMPDGDGSRRKRSAKQTRDRQRADDIISKVADLNEKETRTMQYIEPDEEKEEKEKRTDKKPPKSADGRIVRPKPRYAAPKTSESRPESAKSFNSSSEIRDSIYQDWYKERTRKAKEEAKRRQQKEKEAEDKKNKEKMEKLLENKAAYDSWKEGKTGWVKDKVKAKKNEQKQEENKMKEKLEKEKDAEMAFKMWKEQKDHRIIKQVKVKRRDEEKKKEEQEDKKSTRRVESADLFESWKSKKDEKLINTHKDKKRAEREKQRKEEEEARLKEEEAKQSYERWLENSERRQQRMTLRMSQSMEDLKNRRPWTPAKVNIAPKNCRIVP